MNFLTFLKDESIRSIQKLYNATSQNLKDKTLLEEIKTKNPFNVNIPEHKNFEQSNPNTTKN